MAPALRDNNVSLNSFKPRLKAYLLVMNTTQRRCGVSAILAPSTNVVIYLLTYLLAYYVARQLKTVSFHGFTGFY